ncbi:helix-hairpin-helix domain-containing protein [Cesiribacter sp. SM1]|uniref:ComEA family DNA-binding protein n=1 Tax=Cesiribacter sp. SM1 TaxID=2861196 RepID=UPI001CD463EC|nr:helix-hairpin-helix domain-containing protein [Cesiribacter sp. SM1]
MWQRWLRYIRNFFGFTRGEARGFTVLAIILLLVYAGWFVYRMLPAAPYSPVADQQQLDSLLTALEATDTLAVYPRPSFAAREEEQPAPELFPFNPNTLPYDSLLRLGFPPALARRLDNYRSKGGRFRKKEDLLKIYGLPSELYQTLEPWILLPDQPAPPATRPTVAERNTADSRDAERDRQTGAAEPGKEAPAKASTARFDLNRADSMQLLSVRGIGPVLSGRILKFRNALGGFVQAEQVREVWGLPPEAADALLERAYLPADAAPRYLDINTADASRLAQHPYINHKQAAWIVAYRSQHGPFRQAEDLLNIHTLDESFVNKLRPYLRF